MNIPKKKDQVKAYICPLQLIVKRTLCKQASFSPAIFITIKPIFIMYFRHNV